MSKFRITVGSCPDRENLVADIFYEGVQVIEISNENKEILIQVYSYKSKDKNYWEFSLDEFQKIVEEAKRKLIAVG